MTEQLPLCHDDIYDALATLVAALGGAQEVGVHLRPEWEGKPDQAGRWVKDCINRNRADKFDFDQIFWLLREGRKIGCHVATYHIKALLTMLGVAALPAPVAREIVRPDLVSELLRAGSVPASLATTRSMPVAAGATVTFRRAIPKPVDLSALMEGREPDDPPCDFEDVVVPMERYRKLGRVRT